MYPQAIGKEEGPPIYNLDGAMLDEQETIVALPYQTEVMRIDGWKMRELKPGIMAEVGGTTVACDAIMKPEFWDLNYEPGS